MSAFSGKQSRGAKAVYRAKKKAEAEERNLATPDEKRKKNRNQVR